MTAPDLHSKRPAASLVLMLDWAAEFGLTAQQCLVGTRITPATVRIPAAEVTGQQELRAIANIVAALGDRPGLGLQAAARYPVTAFGVWGFAILTSPTLGEAVDVAVRFVRLSYAFCTFETHRHERPRGVARIDLDHLGTEAATRHGQLRNAVGAATDAKLDALAVIVADAGHHYRLDQLLQRRSAVPRISGCGKLSRLSDERAVHGHYRYVIPYSGRPPRLHQPT